jgi:prepilin signal peptidase PulO-like enzyme (type II secretory pathway)
MLFKFVIRAALCTLAYLLWRIPRGVPSVASHISCLLCCISLGPTIVVELILTVAVYISCAKLKKF